MVKQRVIFSNNPYPDISWHILKGDSTNCNKTLVSVCQVVRDKCNRLWVLDSGLSYSSKEKSIVYTCPPKIVVFDLATNKMVKLETVPGNMRQPTSRFINLVIDDVVMFPGNAGSSSSNNNNCDNVFIYLADTREPAIVSYDVQNKTFYRFAHPYMCLDPDVPYITVDGENTTFFTGIIGLALGESENKRFLYFSALNSYEVYRIPTATLQQPNNFEDPSELPITKAFTKPGPGIALFIDQSSKCLLFNPITNGTIVGWNPQSQSQSVMATNRTLLKLAFYMAQDSENSQNVYIVDSIFSPLRKKPAANMVNAKILLLTQNN